MAQIHQMVLARQRGVLYVPPHHKHPTLEQLRRPGIQLPQNLTESHLCSVTELARESVLQHAADLGLTLPPPEDGPKRAKFHSITAAYSPTKTRQKILADAITDDDLQTDSRAVHESDAGDHGSAPAATGTTIGTTIITTTTDGAPCSDDSLNEDICSAASRATAQRRAPAPPTIQLSPILARWLAPRQPGVIPVVPHISFVLDQHGHRVSKVQACAIVSGHPHSSSERLVRVQSM
jgi:hypothetical protein